ncbi:MAG TPA: hypothetical protein VGI17_05710 [Solirubrobacterales bacterium]|jgi:hypothetical protein
MRWRGNGRADLRRWEGIEDSTGLVAHWPQLGGSPEHPTEKLDNINHHLDFMGNGGSKWSREKEKMEHMLAKVGERNGQVRMLLLRPDCEVCKTASKHSFHDEESLPRRNATSLIELVDLRQRFPHLEIRLYEHAPFFRLTFTDMKTVSVGHYQEYWQDSTETPLLLVEDERGSNDWSFFVAFSRYFKAEWKLGDPIRPSELDRLAEKYGLK